MVVDERGKAGDDFGGASSCMFFAQNTEHGFRLIYRRCTIFASSCQGPNGFPQEAWIKCSGNCWAKC